jgi:hypothetical protein
MLAGPWNGINSNPPKAPKVSRTHQ